MNRACPVGHPSAADMKHCPLCGRAYVPLDKVTQPLTKAQIMVAVRERRRAARAAAESAVEQTGNAQAEAGNGLTGQTVSATPAARDVMPDSSEPTPPSGHSAGGGSAAVLVRTRVLSCAAAAVFVSAFALGESVIALHPGV